MRTLQMQAIKKAGQIRSKLKLSMFEPINIFDACAILGVTVRFVPVSMEGMYVVQEDAAAPDILISSLRPFARRVYTCGHELGHHVFGHGTRIDGLTEDGSSKAEYDDDEYLVDIFAGALLMPVAGIEAAFAKRGWNFYTATPVQYFTIASIFGTSYGGLITHCRMNGLINDLVSTKLLKVSTGKILQQLLGQTLTKPHFKIIDESAEVSVVDIETGSYLFLPKDFIVEGDHLKQVKEIGIAQVFVAERPGIVRAVAGDKGFFIRIQKADYNGLAEYRHLED
jgi:Zn-dependent peptidase ImmA (M78 family)